MLASIFAARNGHEVHVYEKNEKLGKKLYITGKGRCNLTNACDMDALFASVRTNSRFLYSAFYGFTNQDAMTFFEEEGLKIKTERGEPGCSPCRTNLQTSWIPCGAACARVGVEIHLNTEVKELILEDGQARG